ncbi:MAG TPA: hypothetical protein PLF26_13385 [Blastocatellia bacterium]|nr:hypothetical protein [Blastocatellia bacterium]
MHAETHEAASEKLADRLKTLSAGAWVFEVDRLAKFESITLDEALVLLGRRFAGDYLESRRQIVWSLIEYAYIRFEPDAWIDPLRCNPRRRSARRRSRGAAA